ncbi:RNA polymerase factor sigma-54 [Craterilacuibacter sp. RT1T]|uniref:RNA polymerase factor sigma-54 n=1 Tax=Craterilacuibacter sp. RT1T TaxID=2942211 RepID=UPI0020C16B94|nr:RNA polymerase factor sigma-54 [Craterilacuibacter sp. RT1T]MCL6263877.1 RNA polymerase factor sigma-54 [Craterilacuibacter sp. RT1T]
MKQTLQLKVSQQLTLTPQLQQSIKLLQMSTLEFGTELERYLQENPLLERSEDGDVAHEASSDDPHETPPREGSEAYEEWGSGSKSSHSGDDSEFDPILNTPEKPGMRALLMAQMGELTLSSRERALLTLLIEEIDDDGYLSTHIDEISQSLPEELEVETEELEYLRQLLRQMEPPGIGSYNLSEFLTLQLNKLPDTLPAKTLARTIIQTHLALLGNRDYGKLRKLLDASEDEIRAAQALIAQLRPRPAGGFDGEDTRYVMPDVVVRKFRGRWIATINGQAQPKLRVNSIYANLLQQQRDSSNNLSGQLQEARWLVKNIQQRFDTILKVSEAIVDRQQQFFEQGEVAMRPLILRDIADELGLHESTISRVTTQKYLLCSRGLFELKYFFGSALDTDSGVECSSTAIKAHIRRLIVDENSKKPWSDNALAEQLAKLGIQVARRTVAKYREAMQIAPASQRKAL